MLLPESVAEQVSTGNGYDWFRYRDNQRVEIETYDDLDFLTDLPGLQRLYIVRAQLQQMPELSGLRELETVWISEAKMDSLDWLKNSAVRSLTIRESGEIDPDILKTCANLDELKLDITDTVIPVQDLETMNGLVKSYMKKLIIAGDSVFNPDEYEVDAYSTKNGRKTNWMAIARPKHQLGSTICKQGSLQDLAMLAGTNRLRELTVAAQPIISLSGLEKLENLQSLRLVSCLGIRNLQGLGNKSVSILELDHCTALSSLAGIEELSRLTTLRLSGLEKLRSLKQLQQCDFTYVNTQTSGFRLYISDTNIADLSPLSGIEYFLEMEIPGPVNYAWNKLMKDKKVISLKAEGIQNQQVFEQMCRDHPELEKLELDNVGRALSDLKPLCDIPDLKLVILRKADSKNKLAATLKGTGYRFTLKTLDK